MKKLILYIPLILFADFNIEKINDILSSIKVNNNPVVYYSQNENFFSKLKVQKANSINEANIIIFPKKSIDKISIVDSYDKLKSNNNSIGAIYIKKGRTQIIFVDERIKTKGFTLSNRYNQYIIKECYLNKFCSLK